MARREFDLQDLAASVFDAFVLANAPDVPLKALVQLGGLTANAATQSTVTATLCGVADLLAFDLSLSDGVAAVTFTATSNAGELITGAINAGDS